MAGIANYVITTSWWKVPLQRLTIISQAIGTTQLAVCSGNSSHTNHGVYSRVAVMTEVVVHPEFII